MVGIGILGLDSSHAVEFTRLFNRGLADGQSEEFRVVASCSGPATDFPLSRDRRDAIGQELREVHGIQEYPTVGEFLSAIDTVMLLSSDGRRRYEEARPLFSAAKPLFIDKPLATSLVDAGRLLTEARAVGCPVFSASSLRYRPSSLRPHPPSRPRELRVLIPDTDFLGHPAFCWLGIHGIEAAFATFGPGCRTATRVKINQEDTLHLTWPEGAEAFITRSARPEAKSFPTQIHYDDGRDATTTGFRYEPLLLVMAHFFLHRKSSIDCHEMLEVIACIDGAEESARQSGREISINEIIQRAAGSLSSP